MKEKKRILIINSNIELIIALEEWLHSNNCETMGAQIYDLKNDLVDISTLLNNFKPDAIIYDVSIPYEENWKFFKHLTNESVAKNYQFIVTTTNKQALEKFVGKTNTFEIIGKPFELEELEKIITNESNYAAGE